MTIFHFDVDEAWAKENNELLRDTSRLQLSAVVMGLIFAAAGVAAWFLIDNSSVGLLVLIAALAVMVLCFIIAWVVPRKVGTAQQLYDTYPLAPAIIAEVNPRDVVLLALVNTSVDPEAKPRWALATRTVTRLKGHPRTVGTRVPVAAVSGRRKVSSQGQWDEITPMPIAWGTPDEDIIAAAAKEIPFQQWQIVEKHAGRADEVQKTQFSLLEL
ncbi:hypothetical membrane protein [Corynebacterium renale]|uniref:DUF3239 domain-containing protein n=1 Tax=Corynebacterium renale TaxID=1724 RepID=UPI000DA412DA|nr:DUF3239 domain-containing protein [Corynebacterium renale]SQG64243.1 hypothetical membrane protein [Corynebacterium renale]STC94699.1 hypothetical membrane protein [Corynebacterium renale]